jgi:hypothetical protein
MTAVNEQHRRSFHGCLQVDHRSSLRIFSYRQRFAQAQHGNNAFQACRLVRASQSCGSARLRGFARRGSWADLGSVPQATGLSPRLCPPG